MKTSDSNTPQSEKEVSLPARILVVDDDPAACELIQEVLASAEIQAYTIDDSKQASAVIRAEKFDAIFLDVHMPAPDGFELTRQVRASGLNRTTPIVVITGDNDRHVLTRAFDAGASFVLFKPINRQRLLRLLRVSEDLIQREARQFQRVKVSCKVSLEHDQQRFSGNTVDMSLNGAMIRADKSFLVGSLLRLEVELTHGRPPLRGAARVVRSVGSDCMGLHFEDVDIDETKRLQEFLLPLILAAGAEAARSPVSPKL